MQTDYVYNADELTVKQEKDVSYMKECVKKAYGVDIQAYVDGGNGGKREDQEIDEHINDLIQKLSYKWSMEDSSNKKRVEEIVNEIYKK